MSEKRQVTTPVGSSVLDRILAPTISQAWPVPKRLRTPHRRGTASSPSRLAGSVCSGSRAGSVKTHDVLRHRLTRPVSLPATWRLRGDPVPAIRRGFLVAIPVAAGLLAQLGLNDRLAGGFATAAMFCGFLAFDAPARVRVRWQLVFAPVVGLAAALGVLTSQTVPTAVVGMGVMGVAGGYLVAVSPRVGIGGLTFVLTFLVAQGLDLGADKAAEALAVGICGGLAQAACAAVAWALWDRQREGPFELGSAYAGVRAKLSASFSIENPALRHALRFGLALAVGVAIYRLARLHSHGYWVPLTILFVLKPDPRQTTERIAMRAAGTVLGLVLATVLAELLSDAVIPTTIVLTTTAALSFALLAIEYALFTTAITVYVVLLTDTLGTHAFDAAGERALGTVLGILVAALAFRIMAPKPLNVPQ
jgi:Fusaric acid resistance protein-like